ncbi:hypothetical protein GCM10023322_29870 [Rugosimonospora acidiphila]|uniref:Uncharacterized protein n=1 Tax=Rugosimonospora acidiphila TaxID=556531 RepID=A0ABP9RRH1_9ACTN
MATLLVSGVGEYRPEWTWIALRDGTVVARAAWWQAERTTGRSRWTGSTSPTRMRRCNCCAGHRCTRMSVAFAKAGYPIAQERIDLI